MMSVVMGVCGSGKSTPGQALAQALACDFQAGGAQHRSARIDKMYVGVALDDADRWR